jgi:hypothetical protein
MSSRDDLLWTTAIATYGIGDIITTQAALEEHPAVFEGNDVATVVLDRFGPEGMILMKVGVLMVASAAYDELPEPERIGIPIGLSLLGIAIVANNTMVLEEAMSRNDS